MSLPYILIYRGKNVPVFKYWLTREGKIKAEVVEMPEDMDYSNFYSTVEEIEGIESMLQYVFEEDISHIKDGVDQFGNEGSFFEDWTQYLFERIRSDGKTKVKSFS